LPMLFGIGHWHSNSVENIHLLPLTILERSIPAKNPGDLKIVSVSRLPTIHIKLFTPYSHALLKYSMNSPLLS
jgi:hypothetical protein